MVNEWRLFCMAWALLIPLAGTAAPGAVEIMESVHFVNHFFAVDNLSYGSRRHPIQLANLTPEGVVRQYGLERHLNNAYDEGELRARDLVIFRSGKPRGTGILVDLYRDAKRPLSFAIWLPALRKVRRHAEPDPADVWGGSVFTYGDIYLRRPADESHELLGEARFEGCLRTISQGIEGAPPASCAPEGRPVWRIRSRPRKANWWYDYRDVLVDRETFADYRSTYYKAGQPIKVIDKDWRSMGLDDPRGLYWLYIHGQDLRTGNQSLGWAGREQIRWNQPVDKRLWSLATLRRLRR